MIDRIIARRDAQPVLDKAQMTRRVYRLIRLKGIVSAARKPKALKLIKNCLVYMEEVIHRMTSAYYHSNSTSSFALISTLAVMWSTYPLTWLMTLIWDCDRNFFTDLRRQATQHFLFLDPRLCESQEDVQLKRAILELLKYFIGQLDPQYTSVNDVIEYLQRFERGSHRTSYVVIPKEFARERIAEVFIRDQLSHTDVVKLTLEYFGDGIYPPAINSLNADAKSNPPEPKSGREEKELPPPVVLPVRPASRQTFFKYSGDISRLNNAFARLSDNISAAEMKLTETIPLIDHWLKTAVSYMKHNWRSLQQVAKVGLYETTEVENFRVGTGEFTFALETEAQKFMTLKIWAAKRPLKVTEEIRHTLMIIAKHAYVPDVLKQQADQLLTLVDVILRLRAERVSSGEEKAIPGYKPYS